MRKVGESLNLGRLLGIVLAITAVVATSRCGWAQEKGETIVATFTVHDSAKVGTTQLAAGDYKVTVEGGQAKFTKGNKVVAQVPCTLKDLDYAPNKTQFVRDDAGRITEIQITGKKKAIELSS